MHISEQPLQSQSYDHTIVIAQGIIIRKPDLTLRQVMANSALVNLRGWTVSCIVLVLWWIFLVSL